MRQSLVAGNWKMNGSLASVRDLIGGLKQGITDGVQCQVAVCPPSVFISEVATQLEGTSIRWGAQNVSEFISGAYTGEVATSMLRDYGCSYAIVGHSERRTIFAESDEVVAKKFKAACEGGLVPILCVGELLEERESGETEAVVSRQLDAVVEYAGIQSFAKAVIAYEPVWAIGTGKTATSEQAQAVHAFIRSRLAKQDKNIAANIQILYGGSVKGSNADELFSMADIDGGLIGGASLDAGEFLTICRAAK